jgi:Zn finger protein HypA/HybF involved in hydrogenase expression
VSAKLKRVNKVRDRCSLPPLTELPKQITMQCEHCLSDLTEHELDIERCDTCDSRINVRMSQEDWDELRSL